MTWQIVSFRPTRDLHEHVLFNVLNTSFEDRLQLRVSGSFLRSAKVLSELEEHHAQAIRLLPLISGIVQLLYCIGALTADTKAAARCLHGKIHNGSLRSSGLSEEIQERDCDPAA